MRRTHFLLVAAVGALLSSAHFAMLAAQASVGAALFDSLVAGRPLGKLTVARLCGSTADGTAGIIFGAVRDVQTGQAVDSATIAASWSEFTSKPRGVTHAIVHRQVTSNPSGWYVLCGVPTAIRSNVAAEHASRIAGPVGVEFGATPVVRVDFTVPVRDSVTGGVSGVARIRGGAPAAGAELRIAGVPGQVRADSLGRFAFARVPAGTRELQSRRIGSVPARVRVDVPAGQVAMVEVSFEESAQTLPGVVVFGNRNTRDRVGFDKRRQVGRGFFLTADQIAGMNAWDIGDLGYRAPWVSGTIVGGKRVLTFPANRLTAPIGPQLQDVSTRIKGCGPTVFLNGIVVLDTPFMSAFEMVIETIRPEELYGMEMYRPDGYTPAQYRAFGVCGTAVFWTR